MAEHVHLRRSRIEDFLSTFLGDWRRDDPWDSLESLLRHRAPIRCLILLDEVPLYIDQVARRDVARATEDLRRLDRFRTHPAARVLLTGSISLRAVARQLDLSLSADWNQQALEPLDPTDGIALFMDRCPGACAEVAADHAQRLAGGNPRWILRLAQLVTSTDREIGIDEVEQAVSRLLDQQPFGQDIGHLSRHPEHGRLRATLELASIEGATEISILAGLQSRGCTRGDAQALLEILRDEFFLDGSARLRLPLLARWLARRS
ncbi:MAG: hypothetical protein KC621_01310 [Myxococcales bacterium]|nr:hypothetical protein [Myxococcales bacterium]